MYATIVEGPTRLTPRSVILTCVGMTMFVAIGCASQPYAVRQYGRMHEVLSGGAEKAEPAIALADAMKRPHAHAVGALAGLEGEITIADGKVWVSRPSGGGLDVEGPFEAPSGAAALLTIAYVDRWSEAPIEHDLGGEALEDFIAKAARRAGVDDAKPFPFVIEGELVDLQAHVINGMCPMKPGVRLASDKQPWRYELERPRRATVIGFYAPDAVGELTHPGTRLHAHVIMDPGTGDVTAHVERLAIAEGAVLKIPGID